MASQWVIVMWFYVCVCIYTDILDGLVVLIAIHFIIISMVLRILLVLQCALYLLSCARELPKNCIMPELCVCALKIKSYTWIILW